MRQSYDEHDPLTCHEPSTDPLSSIGKRGNKLSHCFGGACSGGQRATTPASHSSPSHHSAASSHRQSQPSSPHHVSLGSPSSHGSGEYDHAATRLAVASYRLALYDRRPPSRSPSTSSVESGMSFSSGKPRSSTSSTWGPDHTRSTVRPQRTSHQPAQGSPPHSSPRTNKLTNGKQKQQLQSAGSVRPLRISSPKTPHSPSSPRTPKLASSSSPPGKGKAKAKAPASPARSSSSSGSPGWKPSSGAGPSGRHRR